MDYNSVKKSFKESLDSNETPFGKLIYATLSGSHLYGTNTETSDIDIRGIALPKAEDLLMFKDFKSYKYDEKDTIIYSLNNFIHLASNCNPNVIELLSADAMKNNHIICTEEMKKILKKRKSFFSKKAYRTFSGYAISQLTHLRKLINNEAEPTGRDGYSVRKNRLNKYMMHVLRLQYMGYELISTGDFHACRKNMPDYSKLIYVRNGNYLEENKPSDRFFTISEKLDIILKEALPKSPLPDEPDYETIYELEKTLHRQLLQ